MKFITERHEVALTLNFGKYPVLHINRENRPYESSTYARGDRCRVAWDSADKRYEGMTTHGQLYFDDGKYCISGEGAMLSAEFGYFDVMEMVREANAPVVHRGQTVVVVEDWPSKKTCRVRMMRVPDHISIHCMTVAVLEDLDEEDVAHE